MKFGKGIYKKIIMITAAIILIVITSAIIVLNMPAFGRMPQGKRLERIQQSKNYHNGKFHNLHSTPTLTSDNTMLDNLWDFLSNKPIGLEPQNEIPHLKVDLHHLARAENTVIWFGHSSVFIQSESKRFLVDPVLTSRLPVSLMMKPFKGTEGYTPSDIPTTDYMIITHDHWDHLDYQTVKSLKDKIGKVICPLGVGSHLEYWGYPAEKTIEMDWNETYTDGKLSIHCLPARHFSGRGLTSDKTLWASFMIENNRNIFISGDGGYDTHFTKIAERFPHIDLAIMENGQYSKNWRYIHMLPQDLLKALNELHPNTVMTVHNSKFALSKHSWKEPMEQITRNSINAKYKLITPKIGEKVNLDSPNKTTNEWWKDVK